MKDIQYQFIENQLPSPTLKSLLELHFQVFSGQPREELIQEMQEAPHLFTIAAYQKQQMIGYKMGYRRKEGHFYSWLGCVADDFRGQGIASTLMQLQHEWCKKHGYHTIRTMTYNRWRNMLILNLKHGFNIVGLLADNAGEPKIILEKKLV
ncbi:MAG: GNAT family N-acetyltransferase [Spirosomataceae bacterium]